MSDRPDIYCTRFHAETGTVGDEELDWVKTHKYIADLEKELKGLERFRALRLKHNDEMERRTSELAQAQLRMKELEDQLAAAYLVNPRPDMAEGKACVAKIIKERNDALGLLRQCAESMQRVSDARASLHYSLLEIPDKTCDQKLWNANMTAFRTLMALDADIEAVTKLAPPISEEEK